MIVKGKLNIDDWILSGYEGYLLHLLSNDGMGSAIVHVLPKWETGEVYAQEHRKVINAVNKIPTIKSLILSSQGRHEIMREYLRTFPYEVWYEGPGDPTQYTDDCYRCLC